MEVILPQLIAKIFRNHNHVTHLWMVFTAWWNRSQLTLLHQYFHEHHEYDELITGDLRLGGVLAENSDLLPGMVRWLLQWPAVQMDPEFWLNPRIHVCPRCELPIPQNGELEAETMTFTSYCTTAVHTQCFIPGTLSCEVCSHENCNIRIPVFFDGPQMLHLWLLEICCWTVRDTVGLCVNDMKIIMFINGLTGQLYTIAHEFVMKRLGHIPNLILPSSCRLLMCMSIMLELTRL